MILLHRQMNGRIRITRVPTWSWVWGRGFLLHAWCLGLSPRALAGHSLGGPQGSVLLWAQHPQKERHGSVRMGALGI